MGYSFSSPGLHDYKIREPSLGQQISDSVNNYINHQSYSTDSSTYANLINALDSGVFGNELSNYIKTSLATTSMLNTENQIFNAQQARLARNFSASEAEKSRDWQEYMSGTAYQRGVADMKKAGINPIYAFSQGGASTPVGATAQSSQASVNNVGADNYSDIVKLVADFASSSGNLLSSIGTFIAAIKK